MVAARSSVNVSGEQAEWALASVKAETIKLFPLIEVKTMFPLGNKENRDVWLKVGSCIVDQGIVSILK